MKKFLATIVLGLASMTAFAEASFEQIEGLIQQKNYAAAASGLEGIIQNHPKSAKAFYAMAQAQAGLGNLEKANKALTIATGLNPTLDFAPEGSVKKLKDAITPQTAKIEYIEESHTGRNVMILLLLVVTGFAGWFGYKEIKRKQEEETAREDAEAEARAERDAERKRQHMAMLAKQDAERKAELAAEEALKAHKNYGHERFDHANPDKLKSVKQFKEEKLAEEMVAKARAEAAEAKLRADAAEASARIYRTSAQYTSQPAPTVVHTSNSGSDLLTGVLIGNMMGSSHHDHHESTREVVRERVIEREAPSRSSSWDDTPSTSSRSSSWDDTPSRSSSSSSWDSGSSSSSSSSSSSWDSGSSSSSSDSSSSSSWD